MTYARREEIFSKECLTIEDLMELLDLKYQGAAELMRDIKRSLEFKGLKVRLDIQGKLHVQDYLDYFQIPSLERYSKSIGEEK